MKTEDTLAALALCPAPVAAAVGSPAPAMAVMPAMPAMRAARMMQPAYERDTATEER